jgi:MFS family permease
MNKNISSRFPFYYGWVIVTVSLLTLTVIYGIWWSFPAFYLNILHEFGWSRGGTATIFTVGSVVYGFGSLAAGALVDKFGPRRLVPASGLLLVIGCVVSAVSTQRWHFYVAYGVFMGFGAICAGYVPIAVTLSNWFVRRRGLALGIGLVGDVAPPLLAWPIQQLIFLVGWRAAYALLAAVLSIVIIPLTAIFMRTRPRDLNLEPDGFPGGREDWGQPRKAGESMQSRWQIVNREWAETDWTLWKAIRTFRFWFLTGVMTTLGMGVGIVMNHLVALVVDIGQSEALAAVIFSIAGFLAVLGRLGGFLSDRLGREATFTISSSLFLGSALALVMVLKSSQIDPLYIYAVTFGLGSGLTAPTISSAAADLFGGRNFGTILGFTNIGFGIGHGLGAWIGGVIYDHAGSYTLAVMTAIPLFILMCLFFWLAGPRKVRKMVNGMESPQNPKP